MVTKTKLTSYAEDILKKPVVPLIEEEMIIEPSLPSVDSLRRLYPDMFEAPAVGYGEGGLITTETTPEMVIDTIQSFANDSPDDFLDDIRTMGKNSDTVGLLKYMGLDDTDIYGVFKAEAIPTAPSKISEQEANVIYDQKMKDIYNKYPKAPYTKEQMSSDWYRVMINEKGQAWDEYQSNLPGVKESPMGRFFLPSTKGYIPGEMPTATWLDRVKELSDTPGELVPFVGSGVEIGIIADLLMTAKDFEAGKEVSKDRLLALYQYVERTQRDTTWGYKVADVIAHMIPWGLEFLLTAGVYTTGQRVATEASIKVLEKLSTKTGLKLLESALVKYGIKVTGVIVGGTLRSTLTGLTKVPAGALEKQLQHTLIGDEESIWLSLVKSAGENWVETISESAGELLTPLAAPIKGQLVKMGIFKAFLKANPTKSANDIRRIVEKLGYNGIIGEMFEERIADVGHGILYALGLGDQKFSIPSLEQLGVELAAFSIPAIASKVAQEASTLPFREERGAITIPPVTPEPEVTPAKVTPTAPMPTTEAVVGVAPVTPEVTKWDIQGFGRTISPEEKTFYESLAGYTQKEIPELNRKFQVDVAKIGALGAKKPELKRLASIYGNKKTADTQEFFHEIGHSLGLNEVEANKFSVEQTGKYLTAIPKAEIGMPEVSAGQAIYAGAKGVGLPGERIMPKPEVPTAPPTEELPLLSTPPETTLPMPDNVNVSEDRVVRETPPPKEPPPSEPPPTHPSQPAPIEGGRLVMPDLQPSQQVVDLYSKPDFWRRVANLPLVKKAVGLFNPAAVANDPARQALILRAVLKDEAAQKAQAVISHIWEIGTQDRIWGKTDEMGLLTKEPFVGISLDDIRTYPSKYAQQMTAKQKEWIKRAGEIEKAKLDALKRNEIDINELSFEDGGQYAGRRVIGKFNDSGELIESGRIGIGGRVGAKMPFEKTRIFKEASDGINAGYRYMNSDEALYYNTLGAYYKIADKQMAEWVLTKVDWRTTAAPEALVLQAESGRIRLRKAQQLLAALNRAVRGERVPSATINSIASVYSDQADTLKTLIPELQKPSPETAGIVRILDSEAKALISEARLEYAQAVDKRARAREEALRVKYEEASIAHPAFQGKIFTGAEAKEIADILRAGLQPQFIEALGAVNKVNAIGRFFMLAGDASPMAIQLQFLAFYRPVAYAKSWSGFVKALYDPEFQYRQYANNRDLINRHPTLILSGRGTEFTEFMGRGGLGKKLGVLTKPLVPFQKAFEGCLDTAGIELAKSLDHLCTTPERTLEVDQFINEFRGITSSARIGVSSTQRQAETAILLAPRYNRAIAAYLFDIVHGGIRGHQARMSLAQGLAGLAAMAVAISIALGEDEDEIWEHFNPESPKFFTWDVMGVKVGLGGKVRSVIKTFGNMTRTGEIGQPALNFLRGNLAPGASTGLDLITGKNYIGEPTRDNVLDFTKTVGRNFMPIWTQSFLMEGGTLKDKAIIATAEFFGFRGYDISARKEMKIKELEELLGEIIGKTPVLTKKKPDIYQTNNIYSDIKKELKDILPEDVLADKGYAGWGHFVIRIEQSEDKRLPDIRLQDYNFDKTKGDIVSDYMLQWAERQRLTDAGERATYTRVKIVEGKEERTEFKGLAALDAHKVDYPNAQRGNLTRRQRELLLEYNASTNKKQFIKDNPAININPQTEWYKSHPKENAEAAIVGQANILTKEAYNQFKGLLKTLDIPDSGIPPLTLPPATSIDTHFRREELVTEGKEGSPEGELLLLKDYLAAKEAGIQSYAEWHNNLEVSDKTVEYWQMKVDNQELYDKMKALKEDETLTDKQREDAYAEVRTTKVGDETFGDIERRVDVMGKGTRIAPIAPEIVDAYVKHYQIVDKTSGLSAEAKLDRYDNSVLDAFLMNEDYWGKQKAEPLSDDKEYLDNYLVPRWRIDVKYVKEDDWYNNGIPEKHANIEYPNQLARDAAIKDEREIYDRNNLEYYQARYRRDAYGINSGSPDYRSFPLEQIDTYVDYYTNPDLKNTTGSELWFEDDWYIQEHPEFYKTMIDMGLWKPKTYQGSEEDYWRRIPPRDIFEMWLVYDSILGTEYMSATEARKEFRRNHPRFDAWGVLYDLWKPVEGRGKGVTTRAEQQAKEWAAKRAEIERIREEIERKLQAMSL